MKKIIEHDQEESVFPKLIKEFEALLTDHEKKATQVVIQGNRLTVEGPHSIESKYKKVFGDIDGEK